MRTFVSLLVMRIEPKSAESTLGLEADDDEDAELELLQLPPEDEPPDDPPHEARPANNNGVVSNRTLVRRMDSLPVITRPDEVPLLGRASNI